MAETDNRCVGSRESEEGFVLKPSCS